MHQTTTIEAVQVVRPLKIIALIAEIIALILLIVCVAVNDWLEAEDIKMGLWKFCENGVCVSTDQAWIKAVAALCLIPLFLIVGAIVCTVLGIFNKIPPRKTLFYRIAMILMIVSAVLLLLALIIFPIMFIQEINDYGKEKWWFHWCYGLAWGVWLFMIGAAILLFFDRETKQVYYKEKTSYQNTI